MSKEKQTTPHPGQKPASAAFTFGKENYILFAAGILLIIIGFVLMSGGASEDPAVFNEGVFSATRITIAPLLVLLGFAVNVAAIMRKPKD